MMRLPISDKQSRKTRSLVRLFVFSLTCLTLLSPQLLTGQSNYFCGYYLAIPPNGANPDSLIYDRFGNAFDFEDLAVPTPTGVDNSPVCNSSYFNPTWAGNPSQDVQDVVCQVLGYVANVIQQRQGQNNCGTLPTEQVEIQVGWISFSDPDPATITQLGLDLSQFPLPSNLAGISTPFFSGPFDLTCNEIIPHRTFIKLNGGSSSGPPNTLDGRILLNSDIPWNFDPTTDIFSGADLFTIALHETMHVLGFASSMGIGLNGGYTLWDQTLRIVDNYTLGGGGANPEQAIISTTNCEGNCWETASGFGNIAINSCIGNGPDVVVGDNAIAPIGGDLSINPNSGSNGFNEYLNMLSHLSITCSGQSESYVMRPGFGSGEHKRTMTTVEQQIFCLIGFKVSSADCDGCYVIAQGEGHPTENYNQYISCCFKTYYSCVSSMLTILDEELLCNDIAGNTPVSITALKEHAANGTININRNQDNTGWDIFTPNDYNSSRAELIYTITGCDCRQHNARLSIFIDDQCPPCNFSSGPCDNLLCINNFENFTSTGEVHFGWLVFFQGNSQAGTPDIFEDSNGNHFLFMGNFDSWREAINIELKSCIEPGCELILNMDYVTSFQTSLEVWGSQNRPCDATIPGFTPIGNSCNPLIPTACGSTNIFDPICLVVPLQGGGGTTSDPIFTNSGDLIWKNETTQNVCYLTISPSGGNGNGFVQIDNISAKIQCKPEINCSNTSTILEVCEGNTADISFQLCAPIITGANNNTLVTPTLTLPSGWVLVGGNPETPFYLESGQCMDVSVEVQAPSGVPVGAIASIGLSCTASGLCTEVAWSCETQVVVVDCNPIFACPCTEANTLNIDASATNPQYSASLGGTLWSAYAQANNLPLDELQLNTHNGCIAISGRLIIDRDLWITDCQNIYMQPCSEIVVGDITNPNVFPFLRMDVNASISGCVRMWKGITVMPRCSLLFSENTISDAEFAIRAAGSAFTQLTPPLATSCRIQDNTFIRNHVGVLFENPFDLPIWPVVLHEPFYNNYFYGKETGKALLPPCDDNLPNHDGQTGYAGVMTEEVALSLGVPGAPYYTNQFFNVRNGILASNTWQVKVDNAEFNNIVGFSTEPSYSGTSTGVGVMLDRIGFASVTNSEFETCGHGIYSENTMSNSILKNKMPDVRIGVEARGPLGITAEQNHEIHFRDYGIEVFNPNYLLQPYFNQRIENNILKTLTADDDGNVEQAIAIHDAHNPGEQKFSRITNNQVFIKDWIDGILLHNTDDWLVDENEVTFQDHLNGLLHGTRGIYLRNSNDNYLYHNTVTDASTEPFSMPYGIETDWGAENTFCCNNTFGTDVGILFFGNCDKSILSQTNFNNHTSPLHCEKETIIGQQPDQMMHAGENYSNKFWAGSGQAFHGGNNDQVFGSQFRVKSLAQPEHPEDVLTPDATLSWFAISGIPSLDFCTGCNAEGEQNPRREEIEVTDLHFADGVYANSEYGATLLWEGRLRLFGRLREQPELLGEAQVIDSFYVAAQSNEIAAFYSVEAAVQNLSSLPPALSSAVQVALDSIGEREIEAENLLAGLASANTWEDSLNVYRTVEVARVQSLPFHYNLNHYRGLADSIRDHRADEALVLNALLPGNNLLQTNRKNVNGIYLETVGHGIYHLDPIQFQTVTAIANQCPLVGGTAVYKARSLHQLNERKSFDDNALCFLGERSAPKVKQKNPSTLSIRPNPASEMVLILLPQRSIGVSQFVNIRIMDINSRVLYDENTLLEDRSVQIDTSRFPEGMYLCTVILANEALSSAKFIVTH